MKKIIHSFIVAIIFSCQSTFVEEKNANNGFEATKDNTGCTISENEAIEMALEFRNSLMDNSFTRATAKDVASVYSWRSVDLPSNITTRGVVSEMLPDTLLYIVNFTGESGYALVSANTVFPDVVAYVEQGSLSPNDSIDNPGFMGFLDSYKSFIRNTIDRDLGGELPFPYLVTRKRGPLLTTDWGQGSPYNNNCPPVDSLLRCPAGCVAIAIGQIAAYHRWPNEYNNHVYEWDSILAEHQVYNSDTLASRSVAELIHDIGLLVGMNYDLFGSEAQMDSVPNCLNAFGFHYQRGNPMTFERIKENIYAGNPIFAKGCRYVNPSYTDSHAWVIDGTVEKVDYGGGGYVHRRYVHCNWGYYGNQNGYFILGAFDTIYDINTDQGSPVNMPVFNYILEDFNQIFPQE